MTGKEKCEILKKIRHDVAVKNGIEPENRECTFKGECKGTCPACEADAKRIQNELDKKRGLGVKIAAAGLSVAMLAGGLTGCRELYEPLEGDVPYSGDDMLMGEIGVDTDFCETDSDATPNDASADDASASGEDEYELEGDVLYYPEETTDTQE